MKKIIYWKSPGTLVMVPPLPEQPMPNAVCSTKSTSVTQTGLTMMEQALLSEEEKMITLKNRGLA